MNNTLTCNFYFSGKGFSQIVKGCWCRRDNKAMLTQAVGGVRGDDLESQLQGGHDSRGNSQVSLELKKRPQNYLMISSFGGGAFSLRLFQSSRF